MGVMSRKQKLVLPYASNKDNNQPAHSPFLASIFKSIQLLMLCTARTVWSDAVIRPACLNVLPRWWPNKYKSRMIYWQTAYASVVLMEVTGVIRGLPTDDDKWNPYDSVVLTKDTGVKQEFADRWWPMKSWKKKTEHTVLTITKCFLKTDKNWFEYWTLNKILVYRPPLSGRAIFLPVVQYFRVMQYNFIQYKWCKFDYICYYYKF